MGLFDVVNQVVKVGLDVATLPIDIIKDATTLGGSLIEEDSSIVNKLKKTLNDIDEISDRIDD